MKRLVAPIAGYRQIPWTALIVPYGIIQFTLLALLPTPYWMGTETPFWYLAVSAASIAYLIAVWHYPDRLLPGWFTPILVLGTWLVAIAMVISVQRNPWELQLQHQWLGPSRQVWAPRVALFRLAAAVVFGCGYLLMPGVPSWRTWRFCAYVLPLVVALATAAALLLMSPPPYLG